MAASQQHLVDNPPLATFWSVEGIAAGESFEHTIDILESLNFRKEAARVDAHEKDSRLNLIASYLLNQTQSVSIQSHSTPPSTIFTGITKVC